MNKKLFYGAFAFAALGLASCSSDEPVINGGNETLTGDKYVAVNILTPSANSTRAEGDDEEETTVDDITYGYLDGTSTEGEVKSENTRFYFFDETGAAFNMTYSSNVNTDATIVTNMVQPKLGTVSQTPGNAPTINGVLVLGIAANQGYQGVVPFQAVCVANLKDASDFQTLAGKSLDELAEEVHTMGGEFVMTSSNYPGAQAIGATILANSIFDDPDKAEQNPVDFYLERLKVKVQMATGALTRLISKDADGNDAKYTIFNADGSKSEVSLAINLTDYQVINQANKEYLFKKLPTTTPVWSTPWFDANYHRSFWAETCDTPAVDNKEFKILEETGWTTDPTYCYELTNGDAETVSQRGTTSTAIAVRGYVQKQVDGNWVNIDLVRWAGNYYESSTLQYMVANSWNADKTNPQINAKNVKFIYDEKNTYKAVFTQNGVDEDGNDVTIAVEGMAEGDELGYNKIQYWVDGATSFVVNIQQAYNADKTPVFGVVRNHIYSYTFDNVIGLGVPGDDVENPEETQTYLAARVNILQWRVVNTTVTLQ